MGFDTLVKLCRVFALTFFIIVCLVACGTDKTTRIHGYHQVEKGETLFSISWRYGLDTKQLARWNGIGAPYTIYPGQRLRLNPSVARSKQHTTKTKSTKTKSQVTQVSAKPPGDWRWPVKGKILSRFSKQNNGIDIVAKAGTPIVAASAGKVVYAGSGLRGYGNLLILKHNKTYFSAYAHNRRLFVKEGVSVKTGEKIAEVGSTGTDRAKLHFEIRRDGNPVDPLKYLPH